MQSLGASATRQQGVLEKSEAIEQVCTTLPGDARRECDGMSRLCSGIRNTKKVLVPLGHHAIAIFANKIRSFLILAGSLSPPKIPLCAVDDHLFGPHETRSTRSPTSTICVNGGGQLTEIKRSVRTPCCINLSFSFRRNRMDPAYDDLRWHVRCRVRDLNRLTRATIGSIQNCRGSRHAGGFAFTISCNLGQRLDSSLNMTCDQVRQGSA